MELTHDNLTQSRLEKYQYTCNTCIRERLTSMRGQYRYEAETDTWRIKRSQHTAAPHFVAKNLGKINSNYELLVDTIRATEQFRADRMFNIVMSKGHEPKDRHAAISYLLKTFDLLTKQQCLSVINAVHRLIGRPDTPGNIKVRLADELRAFIGSKQSQEVGVSSYEQMLQEDGEVKLE